MTTPLIVLPSAAARTSAAADARISRSSIGQTDTRAATLLVCVGLDENQIADDGAQGDMPLSFRRVRKNIVDAEIRPQDGTMARLSPGWPSRAAMPVPMFAAVAGILALQKNAAVSRIR